MSDSLFKVGDRVRFYERDWLGIVRKIQVTTTPPHRGRPTYVVSWTGTADDGSAFADELIGMEEFELAPYDGWDVPRDRQFETVERWLTS